MALPGQELDTGRSAPSSGADLPLENEHVARRLDELAELLHAQHAKPFRVRAYRNAAVLVRRLRSPLSELLANGGTDGLTRFRGIGDSLARTIEQLVTTDHLALLDRLRGEAGSEEVFATVPGIGPKLARRIHEELGIESLAELEAASHDGRLARVPGMGRGRVRAVRESLAGRFQRHPHALPRHRVAADEPPVSELLDVDREYRERADRGQLPRIAPRRFNPTGARWLPILHTARGERHYTALHSNTAHAHELRATHDWVVIYRDDHGGDGQWTVLTARRGQLRGQRIVAGREDECEPPDADRPRELLFAFDAS